VGGRGTSISRRLKFQEGWRFDGTSVLSMGPALTNPGAASQAKKAADFIV
jgi:hypothetical protein